MLANRAVRVIRIGFGVLPIVAIGWQFNRHLSHSFNVLNFFSYFTNIANLFAAIVLICAAFSADSRGTALPRLTAVVAMTIVGIVFSTLLRGADLGDLNPWVNLIVHYLMPCIVVLDWLLLPPTARLTVKDFLWCLAFPLLYVVYTLARGALTDWYPYPFLNPAKVGGYSGVAMYSAGITALFIVSSGLLVGYVNRRLRPPAHAHYGETSRSE